MSTGGEGIWLAQHGPYDTLRVLETGTAHESSAKIRASMKAKEHIGVDMQPGKHVDLLWNLEEPLEIEPVDVVVSFSTLEHCKKPWVVAENLQNILKPGGLLLVSAPFQWRIHAYPSDYFRFTPDGLKLLFPLVDFTNQTTEPEKVNLTSHINGKVLVLLSGRKKEI